MPVKQKWSAPELSVLDVTKTLMGEEDDTLEEVFTSPTGRTIETNDNLAS